MDDYPNNSLLVTVDWLKQCLGDPQIRILDVRASDPRLPIGYRMGHIPGAIALDPTRDFFVFAHGAPELAPPEKIAQALAQRGIAEDTLVVIYDEWTGQLAALTYWAMRYAGHQHARVLHGGWAMWRNSNSPTTRDVPPVVSAEYQPHEKEEARATAEWIRANSERSDVLLLDVRTADEFRMGHIPGAVNLPYDSALDLRTQTFKDTSELQRLLAGVGVTPDKEIVTYCAAGSRSAHMFTTLELLGYARVRNYDGSMTDWYHRRGLPID
ncbi:MAG: sulfurtransferase [Chloroflexi bacterium]|nr:sulfurtransferase [Chloroflexota bacterium]